MKNNRFLFTLLTLVSPAFVFAATDEVARSFLYGTLGMAIVTLLFGAYALMRSGAAGSQLQSAGASTSHSQATSAYASTGNDHVVKATNSVGTAEGFSSGHTGSNDVFDDELDILMDHEYDGIQELNNKLPPWWVGLFYFTIFIACIYPFVFHEDHDVMYQEEMAAAKIKTDAYVKAHGGGITEESVTVMTDEADLKAGGEIFATNCTACHLADGGGSVGPNLTDKYWLHGGGIKDIFKTIKYGVPEKGMVSWKSSLSPKQIQQVASFIKKKLQGTTPAVPKDPQGEEYTGE